MAPQKTLGPTIENCAVINLAGGGAAIHAEGNTHIKVRNFTALNNEGPVFKLERGATVDADGVFHAAAHSCKPREPKELHKQKFRRGKRK